MAEKSPDEIMAGYLLRGGKMLAKTCPACGSPLFEVKGEILCAVCREMGKETKKEIPVAPPAPTAGAQAQAAPGEGEGDTARELRMTLAAILQRAREEKDPERCLALMEAAKRGAEALSLLQR